MRVGTRRSPAVTKATTTPTTERARGPHQLAMMQGRNLRAVRWLLPALLWVSACAIPAAAPSAQAPPPVPALHRGPPADFVSAAGLRWLLLVKPHRIFADPELASAIAQIVPDRRFTAFTEASGVDLRAVPDAAIAGWAYSTLYVAELPSDA